MSAIKNRAKRICISVFSVLFIVAAMICTAPLVFGAEDTVTVEMDISYGAINITEDTYTYYNSQGEEQSGTHSENNRYVITQTNPETPTSNGVTVTGTSSSFVIELDGVNIQQSTNEMCAFHVDVVSPSRVAVILKDGTENYLYSGMGRAGLEKSGGVSKNGTLIITCEQGYKAWLANPEKGHTDASGHSACTECGTLTAKSGNAWVNTSSTDEYDSAAGIGTEGNGKNGAQVAGTVAGTNALQNLTIAGGKIYAVGGRGLSVGGSSGGGANIGTGAASSSSATAGTVTGLNITGGTLTMYRSDNSAACIGGGYRSGYVNMNIYGGTILVSDEINKTYSTLTSTGQVRAAGIGGGGGGTSSASPAGATVNIYGGHITSSSRYGAAIGSGAGGSSGDGQKAYVYIHGGTIIANTTKGNGNGAGAAIGAGGSLGTGYGGEAYVYISGGEIRANSQLGADIGGGGTNSSSAGDGGGKGNVNISGGNITTTSGGIGGGRAKAGKGGDAEVTISGGTINATSIGGGLSTSSKGGTATVTVEGEANITLTGGIGGGTSTAANGGDANVTVNSGYMKCGGIGGGNSKDGDGGAATVTVTGGTLVAKSIGGGDSVNGSIGYAKADISGGEITGQFIMAGATEPCVFTMTGGRLYGVDAINGGYSKEDGGAVYMNDPNGVALLSGGIIENCKAVNGGAVYMTAGTFTVSGTGAIQNCSASGSGGAVYMGGGTLNIENGTIEKNSAVNGGSIYLLEGDITVSGGNIYDNDATENGGAVYMGGGTLNIENGTIEKNSAVNGGSIYLLEGDITVSGGNIYDNDAMENGGAVYMGGGTLEILNGTVSENEAEKHGGAAYLVGGEVTVSGGTITNNKATENGGAAYLGGGTFTVGGGTIQKNSAIDGGAAYLANGEMVISGGAVSQNIASGNGGAAYLGGGEFTVSGGEILSNTAQNGGGAYVSGGNVTMSGGAMRLNIAKQNGGGVCVNNGNVTMSGGTMEKNSAEQASGGAIYVAADESDVAVVISGGNIIGNKAKISGGALATVGDKESDKNINVTIGACVLHEFDGEGELITVDNHSSCPIINENTSGTSGGAIYVTGANEKTKLTVYCMTEEKNAVTVNGSKSNFMMIDGGSILLSSKLNETNNYGNIHIINTIHVTGGQVDILGDMDTIKIMSNVTIDITGAGNYFEDDREEGDTYYKLEYFENFKDPITGVTTGRYTAYQLKKGEKHDIQGVMYSHEGYNIIGWNDNVHSKQYAVGSTYDGSDGSLQLYAMWEINGYFVTFAPNVPAGSGYSGSTNTINAIYNQEITIPDCGFVYPGYIFMYWEMEGTSENLKSGDKRTNLSLVDGDTVKLRAVWIKCSHVVTEEGAEYPVTHTYKGEGNVITLSCSCKGFSETATVKAENTVYDKTDHVASVSYSGSDWGLQISYLLGEEDFDGTPNNAGTYTAKISSNGASAKIVYVIEKATQPTPSKPTFVLEDNNLNVAPVSPSPDSGIAAQYQLVYYVGSELGKTEWQDNGSFILDVAYTSYYVQVVYRGNENYLESYISKSDATYFIGNVEISVICDEGISYDIVSDTENIILTGLTIDVFANEGYYLTEDFAVLAEVSLGSCPVQTSTQYKRYVVTGIPDDSVLTITISGVSKKIVVTSSVQAGQIFGTVAGNSAAISADSAYTAAFGIINYDTAAYSALSLKFGAALPSGTTVIMLDRINQTYWYYVVTSEVSEVALENMKLMGGEEDYIVSGEKLSYSFIVDFSKASASPGNTTLTSVISAEKADPANGQVPEFSSLAEAVSVTLTEPVLTLESTAETEGLKQTLSLSYSSADPNPRASSIVLELQENEASLPFDSYIKVEKGGTTTEYYQKESGIFIIPLVSESTELDITLCSELFLKEECTFVFDVTYYTSLSSVGGSSLNGKKIDASATVLTFTKEESASPSLSVECEKRVYSADETLSVTVNYSDVGNCAITAYMSYKNAHGEYSSTAWSDILATNALNQTVMEIELGSYREHEGSYCLVLQVSESGQILFEVPYYFIIMEQ